MADMGIEPTTFALLARRSNQLSEPAGDVRPLPFLNAALFRRFVYRNGYGDYKMSYEI